MTDPTPRTAVALPDRIATVLFDLDGTLTDPAVGIVTAIRHAMATLGRPLGAEVPLGWCIGPPLREVFLRLLDGDAGSVEPAIAAYRAYYGTVGLFENVVYPGIPHLLEDLRARGVTLILATSKPHLYAARILERFGLAPAFRAVHGAEFDGTRAVKTELVPWIVATEALDPTATVMVGDREHDVIGARAAGVACIGVAWGYGAPGELEAAGAAAVVGSVDALAAILERRR
ncbi:HAD family hydrolase [Siculibacillus lacustris]|uniref:HAD family hydrolase n=1 Tax=Siculibacillus lacustris TaxID=1549641 RepID=A0A4Q9VID4_9HYPH|nr:HAD hydrolase-like protein [Siculibacillus lacustris]TBW34059.1 HAD family hydrolase [Siculibacillus lacustris]